MAESAKVLSIQSLKDFRVALVTFTEEARNALGGVDMELKRMRDWLERDQLSYWQMQVKRRHEAMMMARTELYRRRISQQGSDAISDTEQKEALKEAQRRLRIAEEKVEAVKKLIPIFHHAMAEYVSRAAPLTDHLSGGIDKSLGSLTKMIDSLEAYLALNAPAAPRVEAMGGSSPDMDFGSCRWLAGRSRRPRPDRGWPGPGSRQGWRSGSGRRRGPRFFTGSGDFHGTEIEPGARIIERPLLTAPARAQRPAREMGHYPRVVGRPGRPGLRKKPPRLDRAPGQAHDRGNGQAFRIAGEDSSPVPGE